MRLIRSSTCCNPVGNSEENPHLAWNVNMNGLYNVLEVAREMKMDRVLVPSSIAVFGPETPREYPSGNGTEAHDPCTV